MSRKNFKVATTENGKTPKQDKKKIFVIEKTNVPTGKVKNIADAKKKKEAGEQEYINRRVNALKRRCKRQKISEEETKKLIEQLLIDIKAPKKYSIHVLFKSGQKYVTDEKGKKHGTSFGSLATEAIKNSKIEYKLLTSGWALIEGGKDILDKLHEILSGWATIHPYEIKPKPPKPKQEKKPSNNTPEAKKAAKERRKFANVSQNTNRKKRSKKAAFIAKRERLAKAKKNRKANIIHLQKNKRSTGSKKASTGLKKAA